MGNFISKCCLKNSASDELIHKKFNNDDISTDISCTDHNNLSNEQSFEQNEIDDNAERNEGSAPRNGTELMPITLEPNCYYKMDHKKRGLALIFNHAKFDHHSPRAGTATDQNRLERTFQSLDFDVTCYEDFKIEQIKNVLKTVAEMDHTDNDCLMVVVLSHGEMVPLKDRKGKPFTTILTHDLFSYLHATDNKYPLQTIWEQFTDERCPTLRNKPRIFLISACQGDSIDEGFIVQNYHSESYRSPSRRIESDISTPFQSSKHLQFEKVKLDRSKTLPQKDFLIIYSSMSGYYSYRDTLKGTWLIDAFCNVLEKSTGDIDLFNLLTLINHDVALEYQSKNEGELKQMPCIVSMLTKLILFKKKDPLANGHIKK